MFKYIVLLICVSICAYTEKYVNSLTKADFQSTIDKDSLQVVHFAQGDPSEQSPGETKTLQMFTKEYERAASVLKQYNVALHEVDCEREKVDDFCTRDKIQLQVFIYRKGAELLEIGVESMFDVDSIVSNVLQVALLREVPIIQTVEERLQFENQNKGKKSIIFSFQEAIGTAAHRAFIEVAYAYNDKFQFAISTDKKALDALFDVNPKETCAIWLLMCQEVSETSTKPCSSAKYRGPGSVIQTISTFVKNIDIAPVHKVESNDFINPYVGTDLKSCYIFFDEDSKEYVKQEIHRMSTEFRGTLGFMLVDMGKVSRTAVGLPEGASFPTLGFKDPESGEFLLLDPSEPPEAFIKRYLKNQLPTGGEQTTDRQRFAFIADLERQDDEVAVAVSQLKGRYLFFDRVPELTEHNFVTETRNADVLIVLFHLPFDALSTGSLYTFYETAEQVLSEDPNMAHNLAIANCYDWPVVCDNLNITSWPTVWVYRKGMEPKVHTGILQPEAIKKATALYKNPAPTVLSTPEQVDTFTRGTEAVALGLTNCANSKNLLFSVAEELHGTIGVGAVEGQLAVDVSAKLGVTLPTVVVFKSQDQFETLRVVNLDSVNTVAGIKNAAMFIFPQLQPATLPALYQRKQPISIFFTPSPTVTTMTLAVNTFNFLGSLAGSGKFSNLIFSWMDMSEEMTKDVLGAYTGQRDDLTLVVVDLPKGHVYVYKSSLSDQAAIENWFQTVYDGMINPTSVLEKGSWKPQKPAFDFLGMIDEEDRKKLHQRRHKERVENYVPPGVGEETNKEEHVQEHGRFKSAHAHTEL